MLPEPLEQQQPKAPSSAEVENLIRLFDQHRLEEGRVFAESLVVRFPEYGFCWKALGVFLLQAEHYETALAALQRAAAFLPGDAQLYGHLGFVFKKMQRYHEAVAAYRRAIAIQPDDPIIHYNLGNTLVALEAFDAAEEAYRAALKYAPDYADAATNLGIVLKKLHRFEEAEVCYRQTLARLPTHVEALNNLGNLLLETDRFHESEICYRSALEQRTDYVALCNLGVVLRRRGRLHDAEAYCRQSLELQPDYVEAYTNLGAILQETQRLDEAEGCLRRALLLMPDHHEAWHNLGLTLQAALRYAEAERCYREALTALPESAEYLNSLANLLQGLGRREEAEVLFYRIFDLKPTDSNTFSNLLFTLNYHPDYSAEQIFTLYRQYDERFGKPYYASWLPYTNDRQPTRRLKIGYVSPDFNNHACKHFLEPLLANHDKHVVEVYAYAELTVSDQLTRRYQIYLDHWIPTLGMSDDQLAARIRNDGIDILIDLAGHTAHHRLGVFARKPAPVSVTWLGYGYTTGLTAIDYILTDAASSPQGSDHLFSETPWRLETPGYAYRSAEGMGEVNSLPALDHGSITFGTLTRAVRINHHTIRVWSEILKRVPGSRLVIDSRNFTEAAMQERLAEQFAAHGIERQRLEIGFHSPPGHMLRQIDITLDCFPHNSGTTLFESLYMGVPFITLAGRPSVGRIGSSILVGVGHPEWIAATQEEYIEKAVALASDLAKLAVIRQELRSEMGQSPLMDEQGFARKVEQAYRQMWQRWCGAVEPSADEISQLIQMFNEKEYANAKLLARKLTSVFPDYGFGWKALGTILSETDRPAEALAALQTAAALLPQDYELYCNLGALLRQMKRLDEAVAVYNQALALNPRYFGAHYNLGNTLKELGRLYDAEICYRQSLLINPDHTDSLNNLGVVLKELQRLSEAELYVQQAYGQTPQRVDIQYNLGAIYKDQGRYVEAVSWLHHALTLQDNLAEARQLLATTRAYLSDYTDVFAESNKAFLMTSDNLSNLWEQRLYSFSYHPDLSDEEIFAEFVRWGDRFPVPAVDFSQHDRTPGRRLRVGYVSPDFRKHTSRFFFKPLFANHDKTVVELFAYSNVNIEDEFTETFKGVFDHWRNIRSVSKEDAAALIRADGIDILVDCCNHMMDDRLDIFTLKPAPIQVTWLGAAWTTGLPMVDYVLFDPYIAPEGTLTREEIIRLPHFFVAYQPPEETAEVQEPPCLQNGYITFGYSGRTERLNHKTFRVWGEILRQVPNSRLILDFKPFSDPPTQEHYRRFMAEHGMNPDQVIMRKSDNIFEGLGDIDILLDCFPHSGGTMLFDALWMGVPALTFASRPPVGRIGTSLMTNLGLPEWVAQTEEEYIAKAVNFAAQPQLLSELRRTMRQRMQDSPVMDGKGFAEGVEQAYRGIWGRWCGEPFTSEPSQADQEQIVELFQRRGLRGHC